MKITIKAKKKVETTEIFECEIDLPVFYKDPKSTEYYAVYSKDHVLMIRIGMMYDSLTRSDLNFYDREIAEAEGSWEKISMEDFDSVLKESNLRAAPPHIKEKLIY